MTCVGAFGATSWNARTRSSSKTSFAGISFRTIRQKRQEASGSGLTAALSVDSHDPSAEGAQALLPGRAPAEGESRGRPEIRGANRRALEPRRPAHDRRPPLDVHVGAEARELD